MPPRTSHCYAFTVITMLRRCIPCSTKPLQSWLSSAIHCNAFTVPTALRLHHGLRRHCNAMQCPSGVFVAAPVVCQTALCLCYTSLDKAVPGLCIEKRRHAAADIAEQCLHSHRLTSPLLAHTQQRRDPTVPFYAVPTSYITTPRLDSTTRHSATPVRCARSNAQPQRSCAGPCYAVPKPYPTVVCLDATRLHSA